MPTPEAFEREKYILDSYASFIGTNIIYIRPDLSDGDFNAPKNLLNDKELTVDAVMSNGQAVEITSMPLDYGRYSEMVESEGKVWAHDTSDIYESLKLHYPNKIKHKLENTLKRAKDGYLYATVLIVDVDCGLRTNIVASDSTFRRWILKEVEKTSEKPDSIYLIFRDTFFKIL